MERCLAGLMLFCNVGLARADETTIPRLTWEPRSDWMNVRGGGAKGDGMADDTAAIQAVLDRTPATNENYAKSLRHRVIYSDLGR